jgi:C4-dicarboxylate-specific signal transduction histidine kinase
MTILLPFLHTIPNPPYLQFLKNKRVLFDVGTLLRGIRASIGGEISIKTDLAIGDIVIEVSDTGPGILKDDLDHIFDPFYTGKKKMGMGVGLPVCHGIIKDHEGIGIYLVKTRGHTHGNKKVIRANFG